MKKQEECVGPRTWKPEELAMAGEPVVQALKEILEDSFPPFKVIKEGIAVGRDHIKEALRRSICEIISLGTPQPFEDRIADGCIKIVDDTAFSGSLDMSLVELVPVLKEGEEKISTVEAIKRAKESGIDFGSNQGKYFIEHWWEMPESIVAFFGSKQEESNGRFYPKILLTGTIWMHPSGTSLVPTMSFQNPWPTPCSSMASPVSDERQIEEDTFFLRLKKA